MGDLAVTVRLHGQPVEDRVLRVRRAVRIGESADASVSFPGADIAVVRAGRDLRVRGRRLAEGQGIGVSLGPVRVWLEHTRRVRRAHPWRHQVDARFLATAMLITVSGLWCETFDAALGARSSRGFVSRQVASLRTTDAFQGSAPLLGPVLSGQRTAAVTSAGDEAAVEPVGPLREGPEAISDDNISGVAYHSWYRVVVPDTPELAALARERLVRNPSDTGAHEILARTAYEQDDYELAAAHFRWMVERQAPTSTDRDLLLRMARTERRLGRHAAEAACYDRILAADPQDAPALAGLATVMARLGRFDEASDFVLQAATASPDDRYLDVYGAVVAAEQGLEEDALALLGSAVEARDQLAPEQQVELRRDIAMDPAFGALRANDTLRVLLVHQLGAAAPRHQH